MNNTYSNEQLLLISISSFIIGGISYYCVNKLLESKLHIPSQLQEPNSEVCSISTSQIEDQHIINSSSPTSIFSPEKEESLVEIVSEKFSLIDTILSSKIHLYDFPFLNIDSVTSHLKLLSDQILDLSQLDPDLLQRIFSDSVPFLLCPMAMFALFKPLHGNEIYKKVILDKVSKSQGARIDRILFTRTFGGLEVRPSKISLRKFEIMQKNQISVIQSLIGDKD